MDGNEIATSAGAVVGGVAGTAFGLPPNVGGQIGGWIGGLFGGKAEPYADGILTGMHASNTGLIDEKKMKRGDARNLADWSRETRLPVEFIAILMAMDSDETGHTPEYVWFAYVADNAGPRLLRTWMDRFNSSGMGTMTPGSPILQTTRTSFPALQYYNGNEVSIQPLPVQPGGGASGSGNNTPRDGGYLSTVGAVQQPPQQSQYPAPAPAPQYALPAYQPAPAATPAAAAPAATAPAGTPAATPANKTMLYVGIGGGVAVLLALVLVLVLRK